MLLLKRLEVFPSALPTEEPRALHPAQYTAAGATILAQRSRWKMWDLTTYHPHDNHDGDYGTPPKLSNMFHLPTGMLWKCLFHLKKKSYRIILTNKINPGT